MLKSFIKLTTQDAIDTIIRCSTTQASTISKPAVYKTQQKENEFPSNWETALPFHKIPRAPSIPLLGSMYKMLPGGEYHGKHIKEICADLRKKLGDIYMLKTMISKRDIVVIFNAEDCETLLRNEGNWPIRRGNESFAHYRNFARKDLFQGVGGLIASHGEEWYKFRSKVNPILMQPRVTKKYVANMDMVANDFINNIRHFTQLSEEMPEDFLNEIYKWSLESIALVALDSRLGCLNLNLDTNSPQIKYIKNVNQLLTLIMELDAMPSFYKYFNTPKWNKFVRILDDVTETNLRHIENAEKKLKEKTDTDYEPSVLEKLLKIDKKVAVTMAMDMMTAGIDTTGKTLGAILYFLAKNPEKQRVLRKELVENLPRNDTPITTEILQKSRYLKAVIKESTRLVPIATAMFRTTVKNIVLAGYQIPKDVDVLALILIEAMSGRHFKRPEEFIPERWLKSMEGDELHHKNVDPFINLPFGYGPRSCVGQRLANLELEVGLAKIIRNFELDWKQEDMKFGGDMIYGIISPLKLSIKEIK